MKKILTKILEEINKDTPRLDYIRGLIEASIEEEEVKIAGIVPPHIPNIYPQKDNQNVDEETIPDFVKAGPIGKVA